MGEVEPFHDLHAPDTPRPRYHTDDRCPVARRIPPKNLRPGTGGFYRCEHCAALALVDERRQAQRPGAPTP